MDYVKVRFRLHVEVPELWANVVVSIRKDLWDKVTTRDQAFELGSYESELIRRWWQDETKRDKVEITPLCVTDHWDPPIYYSERYRGELDETIYELVCKGGRPIEGREERREETREETREEAKFFVFGGLGALLLLLLLLLIIFEEKEKK
jgi:hypothetical protein